MLNEQGITRNSIINELAKSPHGKLNEYTATGRKAASQDPEFLAHLIAWNHLNGQIRDSKVALPIVSLSTADYPADFMENSLAHLALLDPRNLLRAVRFAKELKTPGRTHAIRRLVSRYLENRDRWDRVALQHRRSLKELYALCHLKPSAHADAVLFKGQRPSGSVFEAVANLKTMTPREAAGTILEKRIPFLIAMGAIGKKPDTDLVLALIERMSPSELVTNTKMLERFGIKTVPALRAAYEQALGRAAKSKKNTLKATVAADAIEDEGLAEKLKALQEKQIKATGGIDGDWLVLGDKSGSMRQAIATATHLAATLAKMVNGKVHLVFFDTSPRYIDATDKSYDELLAATRFITAAGGTSIGCGLLYAVEKGLEVDGIAIVSDGGENRAPVFAHVYRAFAQATGKNPPVYLYHTAGDPNALVYNNAAAGIDTQQFEVPPNFDYYSLPNLVQTMRVNRYSLIDAIMETPLVEINTVLKPKEEFVHA